MEDTKKQVWPFEAGTALKFTAAGIRITPDIVTEEPLKEKREPIWYASFSFPPKKPAR